jgi:hypothetical protein
MDIPNDLPRQYAWPGNDFTRIPDWVYTDPGIYRREVERIFHGHTGIMSVLKPRFPIPATSSAATSVRRRSSFPVPKMAASRRSRTAAPIAPPSSAAS